MHIHSYAVNNTCTHIVTLQPVDDFIRAYVDFIASCTYIAMLLIVVFMHVHSYAVNDRIRACTQYSCMYIAMLQPVDHYVHAGFALRLCNEDGDWNDTIYINECSNENFIDLQNMAVSYYRKTCKVASHN